MQLLPSITLAAILAVVVSAAPIDSSLDNQQLPSAPVNIPAATILPSIALTTTESSAVATETLIADESTTGGQTLPVQNNAALLNSKSLKIAAGITGGALDSAIVPRGNFYTASTSELMIKAM